MSIKTSWLKFFVDSFMFFIGPSIFFICPYRFIKGPFIFFFKVLQKRCCFLPCFQQQPLPNPLLIFSGLILWKDLKKKKRMMMTLILLFMVIILLDQQCAEFNERFKKTVDGLNDSVPHGHQGQIPDWHI